MPQKKNSVPQLEGGAKAPGGLVRRQLRAIRNKIPTKEAVVAGSRRFVRGSASVIGKKMNEARVAFGLLSQNFKRPTKRRQLLVDESPPSTPAKGRRSDADLLISPFEIQSPVGKREFAHSTSVTPERRYRNISDASGERRAILIQETAAYRNGSSGISDVTPTGSNTPVGLPDIKLGTHATASPMTPGLAADLENISEGMRQLRAIADGIADDGNDLVSGTTLLP